jgi:hypothetical protein
MADVVTTLDTKYRELTVILIHSGTPSTVNNKPQSRSISAFNAVSVKIKPNTLPETGIFRNFVLVSQKKMNMIMTKPIAK